MVRLLHGTKKSKKRKGTQEQHSPLGKQTNDRMPDPEDAVMGKEEEEEEVEEDGLFHCYSRDGGWACCFTLLFSPFLSAAMVSWRLRWYVIGVALVGGFLIHVLYFTGVFAQQNGAALYLAAHLLLVVALVAMRSAVLQKTPHKAKYPSPDDHPFDAQYCNPFDSENSGKFCACNPWGFCTAAVCSICFAAQLLRWTTTTTTSQNRQHHHRYGASNHKSVWEDEEDQDNDANENDEEMDDTVELLPTKERAKQQDV